MTKLKLANQNVKDIVLNTESIKNNIFKQIHEDSINIFVSTATKNSLEKYCKEQTDISAKHLWKDLLIDSICLLKINDRREKLYSDIKNILEVGDQKNNDFIKRFDEIRKISTYGIDDLSIYFEDLVEFESVLYGTGEYYRDHIHHVLSVWAIGIGLLEGVDSIDIKLNDKFNYSKDDFHFQIEKDCKNSISKSEVWAMWTIIALCHDLGYPLEKASQVNQKIRKIVNHFGTFNFNELNYSFDLLNSFLVEKYLNIISSKAVRNIKSCKYKSACKEKDCDGSSGKHMTNIQSKYHDKLSKSLEDYKHGVLSGLLIFKKLTYFLETDFAELNASLTCEDLRQFYIRKEILRAISGHTCPKIYHLELNTLSFLLILCDEIQDWGRPRFEDILTGGTPNEPEPQITQFSIDNSKTEVDVLVKYTNTALKKSETLQKTIEEHLIREKFKLFNYLLRSAKDDHARKVKFSWTMEFKDFMYSFEFNSSKPSYEMFKSSKRKISPEESKKQDFALYE